MAITNVQVSSTVPLQNVVTWDSDSITGTHFGVRFNTTGSPDFDNTTALTVIEKTATKTYTHTGLTYSQGSGNNEVVYSYYYYIHSADSTGAASGSESAVSSGHETLSGVTGSPGEPTYVLSGTAGNDQEIAITWTAPTELNGGTITGYRIQRTIGETHQLRVRADMSSWTDVNANTNSTAVTITDNTSGLDATANGYYYRIRAITAQGGSPWSNYLGTPVGSAPDTVTVTVTVNAQHRNVDIRSSEVVNDKNAGTMYRYVTVTNVNDDSDVNQSSLRAITTAEDGGDGLIQRSIAGSYFAYGEVHSVTITVVNAAGSTDSTYPGNVRIGGEPPAISDLTATAVYDSATEYTGKIELEWSIAYKGDTDDAFSYKIYRDDVLIETISGADADLDGDYEDTSVVGGTEYVYKVLTDNSFSADPGADSNEVTVTAASTAPSQIPSSDITVTPGQPGTTVIVSWTAPEANGSAITRYTVTCYDNSISVVANLIVSGTNGTITGLSIDTEYTVRVKAVNSIRDAEYSDHKSVHTANYPDVVSRPSASISAPDLTVTWTKPAENRSTIIGYDLEVSTDSGSTWEEIEITGTVLTYTLTSINPGDSYRFRVKAVNGVGSSVDWSNVSSTLTAGNVPDAPGLSLTVVSRDEIDIVVTAPDDNGDTIDSYEVQQREGESGSWETLTGLTLPGTITISDLGYNALYYYRISATNGYGSGIYSIVYGTTFKATGVTELTVDRKTPVTGTNVVLSWTTPRGFTDTEITDDSDKYYIYYLYDENKDLLHTSSSLSDKSADPFDMGSRDKNTYYYFSVSFYDNNTELYATDLVKFDYKGPPETPDAPVTFIRFGNAIDVYWYTPESYSDTISTYDLRYSVDGGSTWESTLLSDGQAHVNRFEQHYRHSNIGYYLKGYTLSSLAHNSSKDYDTLYDAGNNTPLDITGDATTLWVLDTAGRKLYAYTVAAGARSSDNDLVLHDDNKAPSGITTNGTTMWVADSSAGKIYAYVISDNSRDTDKDINLDDSNTSPNGMWSTTTHIYVLDSNFKVYCYLISDGSRVDSNDIEPADDVLSAPVSLYSDSTTLWISESSDNKLYAYDFSDGSRDSSKDVDLGITPKGIHSDGTTLWVIGIPENSYVYSVLATNDYGSSSYSDASTNVSILVPSILSSLDVNAVNENTVILVWDVPSESEFISSYVIERSDDLGLTWQFIKSFATTSDIGLLLDGDSYKYTDTQLASDTSYKYRIKATNTTGSGSPYESDVVRTLTLPGRSGKPIFQKNYQGHYKFGN